MAKTFVLLINQRGTKEVTAEEIEGVLNVVTADWLRFAGNQYYVRYEGSSGGLYDAVKALFNTEHNVIVSEIVPNTTRGWASQLAVDWFAKYQ